MKITTYNKIFSLLFFLLSIVVAYAQEPIVNWGAILQPDYGSETSLSVLGMKDSEVYLQRKSGPVSNQNFVIDKYSKDFSKIYSKEIQTAYGSISDNKTLEHVMLTDNTIIAFYRGWKKATKQVACYAQIFSTDCEPMSDFIELHSFTVAQQLNSGNFNFSISPDKSMVIVKTDMPFVKGEKEKVRIAVYDAQTMKELWSKNITLTNESERGVRNEIYVDNAGNAYMFKTQFLPKNARSYTLFTCNATNQTWTSNPVNLNNKLIAQHAIRFNAKGELTVVGFYGTQNEYKIEGTFYCKVNTSSLKFDTQKTSPLGAQLLKNWKSEKAAMAPGASISDFKILDVVSQSNGNSIIISELQMSTYKNIAPAGSAPKYEYSLTYKDIMAICLNQDGTQAWGSVIPKMQSEKSLKTEPRIGSFAYALHNDRLYCIWNNIELTGISVPPRKWKDAQGNEHVDRKDFDSKTTSIPAFMNVIEPNGELAYKDGTFGLPLFGFHNGSPFPLYVNPLIFVDDADGLILLAEMKNMQRYRIGKLLLR